MKYIRSYYKVPAKVGGMVIADGRPGKIIGANGHKLIIRLEGERRSSYWHPTWNIRYI